MILIRFSFNRHFCDIYSCLNFNYNYRKLISEFDNNKYYKYLIDEKL